MLQLILFPFLFLQQTPNLDFTNFEYKDFDKGGLYTATVTFRRDKTEIDLVSVVHIADQSYYKEIQHELNTYDIVFYELVTNESVRKKSLSSLSALQTAAGKILNLSFQLSEINYQAANLLHSDLSWDQIQTLLGSNPLPFPGKEEILHKILPQIKLQQDEALEYFKKNPEVRRSIKVFLGQLLGDLSTTLEMLNIEKQKGEDVLISARNRKAISVLKPYLSTEGHFALFWGAAHMPDFSKQLLHLGFTPINIKWHLAWKIGNIKKTGWF